MKEKIENRARFDIIRYSQVWEDADILVKALEIKEEDTVLSIASAGDNTFALLAQSPKKVYGVDLSFAQIACCELRLAMYRQLSHHDHLLFGGVITGEMDRIEVLKRLSLPTEVRGYWEEEQNLEMIEKGFMAEGRFEQYFRVFRKKVLPLAHNQGRIKELVSPKNLEERQLFYKKSWNNRRWQLIFKVFFSRFVMGRLGRDKEFFKYVQGSVATRILNRTRHALTKLDPSKNPYLHYILFGEYKKVLPYSLREENYDKIRENLNRIHFYKGGIHEFMDQFDGKISAFNLSDIFEYMTIEEMDRLYEKMLQKSSPDARFAYWNMLAPRQCSENLKEQYGLRTCEEQNKAFLMEDKAFFYSRFYLDFLEENTRGIK